MRREEEVAPIVLSSDSDTTNADKSDEDNESDDSDEVDDSDENQEVDDSDENEEVDDNEADAVDQADFYNFELNVTDALATSNQVFVSIFVT
jgi:hypothetical protein